RGAGPGLHHGPLIGGVHGLDARHQSLLDPRPLFAASRHLLTLALPTAATAHEVAVRRLVLLARAVAQGRHTPRGDRMAPGRRGALAAAVRMVDRVHGGAAGLRAHAHVALAAGLADLHV